MPVEAKYDGKDELTIKFTDEGWEVWKAIQLFRVLHHVRWNIRITDRDRGHIEEIYQALQKAGVDFKKYDDTDYPMTEESIGTEDLLTKTLDELKKTNQLLKKMNPTLSIKYEGVEKL